MAVSSTSATTYARLDLVKLQVRRALRHTTGISEDSLKKIDMGLDNQWIYRVNVYGFNSDNLCEAQMQLEIDWNEYERNLSQGKAVVAIDNKWIDDTAIEVDEVVKMFNSFIKEKSLSVEWTVTYPSHLDVDDVNEKLGFVRAKPVKWSGKKDGIDLDIPELSELRIGYYRVGD